MPPRLAPLEPPYDPALAAELSAMMPPGHEPLRLFRTLAHNPRVLGKIRAGNLLDRGSLERRDRELVILRTCARAGCEYEWGVHAAFFAARVGIGDAELRATAQGRWDDPAFDARARALVRLADELHDGAAPSDACFAELAAHFEPAQWVELLALAGFYRLIAYVANGLRVELEPFAARFPDPAPPA